MGTSVVTRRSNGNTGFLAVAFPHDGLSTAEAGARHQHSPVGTDGCWCLAPLMKHTAVRQMLGRSDVDNVQVAWCANAAQERCICSPSQMAAFDDGDGRGTGRAGGRHPSTVPSHLVSAQSAVSTTSSTHPGADGRIRWKLRLPWIRAE